VSQSNPTSRVRASPILGGSPPPGSPFLAQRGATHEAKRRRTSERAGRQSPENLLTGRADVVLPGGRPRAASEKSGRGCLPLPGVEEFGTFTSGFCAGTGRSRRGPAGQCVRRASPGRETAIWCKRREVRRGRSTEEVGEDVGNARRVDGGKGRGRGKICCIQRILDTARTRCVAMQQIGHRRIASFSVDPRWEPGAGNPLAGICPGGGPKGPSLPGSREAERLGVRAAAGETVTSSHQGLPVRIRGCRSPRAERRGEQENFSPFSRLLFF
jgi:hypothetical protein